MTRAFIVLGVWLLGCSGRGTSSPVGEALVSGGAARDVLVFEGMCDASGAVALAGDLFVVGDDEDNILRVYDARRGGAPMRSVDLSPALELAVPGKKAPEADIEAATRLGPWSFWLTSHGRDSAGKKAPSRLRFFATEESSEGPQVVGRPYARLLEDLLSVPALARFHLDEAERRAPKAPGGLNIEGMTATADGAAVLIGFRSPVPEGKALVVPLHNPREMVLEGTAARVGTPLLLDLGGQGIRSMSFWRGRYLLISGGTAGESTSRLFTWHGGDDVPVPVGEVDLRGFNPEAFFTPESAEEILLLSDDGTRSVDGVACKKLREPARKRFRGVWVRLPERT
ncbi:DUF3616 domain-containing protein [Myxococcus sp. K15C18031901]|uniref:DUF3616 domain-containing protein n=1 Tax=Myxococcus dinghuensis TaxID=2906761 RepID=UPI0020A77892|nr:DUF3616 domain-containing protein [Myxococcus dinghuensis]MCP3103666.1 DUF3616 domain-containing protein [Myxococcus dinghuensis]